MSKNREQMKLECILKICEDILLDEELMSSPYNITLKLVMKSMRKMIKDE